MLGRLINEWKRATSDFTETFTGGSDLKNEIHKAIYEMPEPKKEIPKDEDESGEQLSLAIAEEPEVPEHRVMPAAESEPPAPVLPPKVETVEVIPQVTDPILAPRPAAPNTKPRMNHRPENKDRAGDDSGDIS